MLPVLRDYQATGIGRIRAAVARAQAGGDPFPGVVAVAPTGAGKTVMFVHLAARAREKGNRTLVTVPRRELATQAYRAVQRAGWEDVRVCRSSADGGDEGPDGASVIVSTIQTLIARNWVPDGVKLAVFDEGRHYVADDWGRVGQALMGCVRVFFDATPRPTGGRGFRPLASMMVEVATTRQLVAAGHLVPMTAWAPALRRELSHRPVDAYLERVPGKRCIVYAASVPHARQFAAEFVAAGVRAEVVSGETRDREGPLSRLRSGETPVLCNCMLYTEGLDVVEVEAVILARGVSEVMLLQMSGRARRPAPGKTHSYLIDLLGTSRSYAPVDARREWSIDGKAPIVRESLPPAVQCRKCHAWGEGGGVCGNPACGARVPAPPPPRVARRELSEVRGEDSAEERRERLTRWVAEAMARGNKPWSAAYKYRGTYGAAPPQEWVVEAIRGATRAKGEAA